jgi:hypothetical protein
MHVTKPQVDIDQDHVTSVITAARNVLEDRPPPPPYPDEDRKPPPPYDATSHHKVDEPPSPAPQPGIDELAHRPCESVSQFGVQMRTNFSAEISPPIITSSSYDRGHMILININLRFCDMH